MQYINDGTLYVSLIEALNGQITIFKIAFEFVFISVFFKIVYNLVIN